MMDHAGTSRIALAGALAFAAAACSGAGDEAPGTGPGPLPDAAPAHEVPPSRSNVIAVALYPGFTTLDMIGPHTVFSTLGGYDVQLAAKTLEPVTSDTGVTVTPTVTFADVPVDVEVLFVPGTLLGMAAVEDPEFVSFLRSRGERARFVTSVCTGSLFLGAAGLLRGYKATSHWAALDLLGTVGAEPVHARWVQDGNRITGAGVTAGIDFGLVLASRLKDDAAAQRVQLLIEYDPAPPFQAGSPSTAPPGVLQVMNDFLGPFVEAGKKMLEKLARE